MAWCFLMQGMSVSLAGGIGTCPPATGWPTPVPQEEQQLFSFELDAADQATIAEVLERGRQPTSDCYTWERGGDW